VGLNARANGPNIDAMDIETMAQYSATGAVQDIDFSDYQLSTSSSEMSPWPSRPRSRQQYQNPHTANTKIPGNETSNNNNNKSLDILDWPALGSLSDESLLGLGTTGTAQSLPHNSNAHAQAASRRDSIAAVGLDEAKRAPGRLTLTVHNPDANTVESLMRIALTNKSEFGLQKD